MVLHHDEMSFGNTSSAWLWLKNSCAATICHQPRLTLGLLDPRRPVAKPLRPGPVSAFAAG